MFALSTPWSCASLRNSTALATGMVVSEKLELSVFISLTIGVKALWGERPEISVF